MTEFDSTMRWKKDKSVGTATSDGDHERKAGADAEAYLVVIAHPEERFLGSRFTLSRGSSLVIGRSSTADVRFTGIDSISRHHARVTFDDGIWVEDLGSTNGTLVGDEPITGRQEVSSGDRIQVGAVHFKLLHELDVEHAYHVAVYEMMMRDALTQLFNRRKFDEEAQREFARASRYARPLSLVIFDVDEFKDVNDTYGHMAGDSVLQRIANRARELSRAEQILGRIGGDEFAILCPEVEPEGVRIYVDRLRDEIASMEHIEGNRSFRVTCSFGIASLKPSLSRVVELFEEADAALYTSKHRGRNRVS
jgi:diguanylate cyclase (GGDEF)-like protein